MFPGLTNVKQSTQPVNSKGVGPDNRMINGIATQNLGGNSLTQEMRSLQNKLATGGSAAFDEGRDVTNTGMQGFGEAGDSTRTAMGSTGTAMGTTAGALGTLMPAEDYWQKLLSGDKATQLQAVAPGASQAATNYASATSGVNQNQARGGYAGVLGAGLPQAQAREVNNMIYGLQPQAATALNTIAGTKSNIAGTQGQIAGVQNNIAGTQGQLANWLASLGIDISKLGLSGMQMANESLLGGRGQDVQEHGQAMSMASQLAGDVINPAGQMALKKTSPNPSDIRVKRNVVPLEAGLETILKVNPIEYDYNGKGGTEDGKHYASVSAQELQQVMPESVSESDERIDGLYSDRVLQVDPVPVIWALVNAVKTLNARIEILEGRS